MPNHRTPQKYRTQTDLAMNPPPQHAAETNADLNSIVAGKLDGRPIPRSRIAKPQPLYSLLYAGERLGLDLLLGTAHIDREDVGLLGGGLLQGIELTVHHAGAHVVAVAGLDAGQQHLLRGMQVDEVNEHVVRVVWCHADDVAVLALQRRAGDDHALGGGEALEGLLAELGEPVPAVSVGQGDVAGHLVDVGRGMVLFGAGSEGVCWGRGRGRGKGRTISPSMKGRFRVSAMNSPTVLFPQPAGPVTIQRWW
jgi:hypothetical protein